MGRKSKRSKSRREKQRSSKIAAKEGISNEELTADKTAKTAAEQTAPNDSIQACSHSAEDLSRRSDLTKVGESGNQPLDTKTIVLETSLPEEQTESVELVSANLERKIDDEEQQSQNYNESTSGICAAGISSDVESSVISHCYETPETSVPGEDSAKISQNSEKTTESHSNDEPPKKETFEGNAANSEQTTPEVILRPEDFSKAVEPSATLSSVSEKQDSVEFKEDDTRTKDDELNEEKEISVPNPVTAEKIAGDYQIPLESPTGAPVKASHASSEETDFGSVLHGVAENVKKAIKVHIFGESPRQNYSEVTGDSASAAPKAGDMRENENDLNSSEELANASSTILESPTEETKKAESSAREINEDAGAIIRPAANSPTTANLVDNLASEKDSSEPGKGGEVAVSRCAKKAAEDDQKNSEILEKLQKAIEKSDVPDEREDVGESINCQKSPAEKDKPELSSLKVSKLQQVGTKNGSAKSVNDKDRAKSITNCGATTTDTMSLHSPSQSLGDSSSLHSEMTSSKFDTDTTSVTSQEFSPGSATELNREPSDSKFLGAISKLKSKKWRKSRSDGRSSSSVGLHFSFGQKVGVV